MRRRAFLAGGLAAMALSREARAGTELVYSNAKILLGTMPSGGPTEVTGGVQIADGQIVAIGPSVTGGIDLGGATIWPGVYDAGTTVGLVDIDLEASTKDDVEITDPFQPQMRVIDAFNPASQVLPVVRARGVLGALVIPGGGVVSGQAAWMRTTGATVAAATMQAPSGLLIRFGQAGESDKGPTSRMGVAARLRDALDANPVPVESPEVKLKKGVPAPEPKKPPTRAEQAWHALRGRKLRAIFLVERASDIEVACGLCQEYALDGVLLGGAEAWRVADIIREANLPVLLGPVTAQPDSFERLHARYDNAALLHRAGVRFALRLGDPHRGFDLTTEAGIACAWGLPREVAIAAIGGNAPGFFNLTQGRLRVGNEASFVISDGDPLEPRTSVKRVVVQGVDVGVGNRQVELFERFGVLND